jgi:hypothetical protein
VTRVLVWKELREQWVVWLALAVVAVGGVATLHALLSPNHYRDEMLVGVLWLSAWGYGLVCGSLLFAGETEEGTQAFLELLPGNRSQLWQVKARVGLGLLGAQAAVFALVGAFFFPRVQLLPLAGAELAGIPLYGVMGYAWGLYSGSRSATVLGAIARGVVAQVVLAALLFPIVPLVALTLQLLFGDYTAGMQLVALTAVACLITAWPVARSRRNYCQTDWQRAPVPAGRPTRPVRPGWGEAFRIASREARWLAVGMAAFGLVGTVAVTALGAVAWPVATVLIGVLCGLSALAPGRQVDAAGDADGRRPSAGRLVDARVGVRIGIAAAAAVLTALVPIALLVAVMELGAREELGSLEVQLRAGTAAYLLKDPVASLFLWLVDGFAVGLLCGACFRRPLVAGLVAVPCAFLPGGLWLPEVFLGEPLGAWQVWGAPAVLLAAALVLMVLQAHGRSTPLRTAGVSVCAGLVATILSVRALHDRVSEIPSPPYAIDVDAYRASLAAEENEGGRLTAAALRGLAGIAPARLSDFGPRSIAHRVVLVDGFESDASLAAAVARHGWDFIGENDARILRPQLDRLFRDEWARDLARAVDYPAGIVIDPREIRLTSDIPELTDSRLAVALLIARGLQRQSEGEPEAFVGHLRTGLALVRSLRHRTISRALFASGELEAKMARGVELWLRGLEGRPELLRRVLQVLREHDRAPRADLADARKADFLVVHNTAADLDAALSFRPTEFFSDDEVRVLERRHIEVLLRVPRQPLPPGLHAWSGAPTDADVIRLALRVPRERVRLLRMLAYAENRASVGMSAVPRSASQLEEITDSLADFFVVNASLRAGSNPGLNRCGVVEHQVALRLEMYEVDHPAEKPGHAEKQSEKK